MLQRYEQLSQNKNGTQNELMATHLANAENPGQSSQVRVYLGKGTLFDLKFIYFLIKEGFIEKLKKLATITILTMDQTTVQNLNYFFLQVSLQIIVDSKLLFANCMTPVYKFYRPNIYRQSAK